MFASILWPGSVDRSARSMIAQAARRVVVKTGSECRAISHCLWAIPLLIGCTTEIEATDSEARLEWTQCWFKEESGWPEASCGYLEVPETQGVSNGRSVRLPFIVFQTPSPQADEPPVLVTGAADPATDLESTPKIRAKLTGKSGTPISI